MEKERAGSFSSRDGDFKSQCINIVNTSNVPTKHALIEHTFLAYIKTP